MTQTWIPHYWRGPIAAVTAALAALPDDAAVINIVLPSREAPLALDGQGWVAFTALAPMAPPAGVLDDQPETGRQLLGAMAP